jgi:CBS domain-containing protein
MDYLFNPDLVLCRPALQKDTDDMLELCSHIWEGGDYIPSVWDEWMADPEGLLGVAEMDGRVVGIVSDGDLRRLLERRGKNVLDLTAADCMTRNPKSITADIFAAEALDILEQKKITSLVVVDGEGKLAGILHLHDLWGTEIV